MAGWGVAKSKGKTSLPSLSLLYLSNSTSLRPVLARTLHLAPAMDAGQSSLLAAHPPVLVGR